MNALLLVIATDVGHRLFDAHLQMVNGSFGEAKTFAGSKHILECESLPHLSNYCRIGVFFLFACLRA